MPKHNPFSSGSGHGNHNPDPLPVRAKQGHWTFDQSTALQFGPVNATYNAANAVSGTHWRSPTFDLRYNLGDVDGFGQQRQKNIEQDVFLGDEFNLFLGVTVTFPNPLDVVAFKFYCIEFGNEMDPNKIRFLQTRRDITSQVFGGFISAVGAGSSYQTSLLWAPRGPLRYWGIAFIVDQVSALNGALGAVTLPVITLTGALH